MNRNIGMFASLLSFAAVTTAVGTDINFINSIDYSADIIVEYEPTIFGCNNIESFDSPRKTIRTHGAGLCAIKKISVTIHVPYTSGSGFGYHAPTREVVYTPSYGLNRTFKLVQRADGSFAVIEP